MKGSLGTHTDDPAERGRNPDGSVMLRVRLLHWAAKVLSVQIKIGGIPFGADVLRAVNTKYIAGKIRDARREERFRADHPEIFAKLKAPATGAIADRAL